MRRPPQFRFHSRSENGRAATETAQQRLPVLRLREPEQAPPPSRKRSRRLLQPLPLAGIALVLIALLGYLAVYKQTTQRTAVLVAARDLPAGTLLARSDLRSAGLAGDRNVLASAMPARQLPLVLGRRLSVALPQGLPLPRAAVTGRAALPSAFTVAVPVLHALGGALQPGDRVSVLATYSS